MTFKLIGSVIVFISCSYMGYVFSEGCSRRPIELRELQALLQMLESEISYMSSILHIAFEKITNRNKSPVAEIFRQTAQRLKQDKNCGIREAWETSMKTCERSVSINAEDRGILSAFGEMLGCTDLEGQIRNIRLAITQLKLQEHKAEEQKKKNCTMYRSLGVLGGLALVIMLI